MDRGGVFLKHLRRRRIMNPPTSEYDFTVFFYFSQDFLFGYKKPAVEAGLVGEGHQTVERVLTVGG